MLPLWVLGFIKRNFKFRFFYASLTKVPIPGSVIEYMFFHKDDMVYLPKDNVIVEVNQEIPFTNTVLPSQIVHKYIDEADTHFVMNNCICRDSANCDDFPIEIGCLFMGKAATKIDPRLGRLVSKKEAHQHVQKARKADLVHLIGRNKLDTVWLDTGPGEKLMTVCNCCPCCCLWKMLPNLKDVISERITAMEGVYVNVSSECVGCGTCIKSCFLDAITIEKGQAIINEDCRGCGRCVEACPENAIKLYFEKTSLEKTFNRIDSSIHLN
jgi:ferredoxin